jgi:hypothetical protein
MAEKIKENKMDFNKLISKLKSIDPTNVFDPNGVSAAATEAVKPAPRVKLDEAAELRVLAGTSTILKESDLMEKAVSKAQQKAAGAALASKRGEGKAVGASKEMAKMSTKELEKFAGTKHKGLPEKKKKDESVKEEMKVGDTKKSSTGGTIEKTKTGIKHTAKDYDGSDHVEPAKKKASKAGMSGADRRAQKSADKEQEKASKDYEKKYPGSVTRHKMEDIEEAAKPDFLDMDKDGDKKEPMKKAVADKKKGAAPKKGVNPFAKKKTVKESVDKLSFISCLQAVKESKGSLQIDPMDKALWTWAKRVAESKSDSGIKAEAFAAKIYESYGGEWSLYNTLTEAK